MVPFRRRAQRSVLPSADGRLGRTRTVDSPVRSRASAVPQRVEEMVDVTGVEPASARCKPAALPLSYTPGLRPRNRTGLSTLCRRPPHRLARRRWCSQADSNCPVRVRSAKSSSRGGSAGEGDGTRTRICALAMHNPAVGRRHHLVRVARLELAYPGWKPSVLAARRHQHNRSRFSCQRTWRPWPESNRRDAVLETAPRTMRSRPTALGWLTGFEPANIQFTAERSPGRASATPQPSNTGAAPQTRTALSALQGPRGP